MNKLYVVAGTYDQYVNYARTKTDDVFYIYVSGPDMLRGLRDPHGVFIGSWIDRSDIRDIIEHLMVASRTQTTFNTGIKRAYELLHDKDTTL